MTSHLTAAAKPWAAEWETIHLSIQRLARQQYRQLTAEGNDTAAAATVEAAEFARAALHNLNNQAAAITGVRDWSDH